MEILTASESKMAKCCCRDGSSSAVPPPCQKVCSEELLTMADIFFRTSDLDSMMSMALLQEIDCDHPRTACKREISSGETWLKIECAKSGVH
jgi:hypothetical protein